MLRAVKLVGTNKQNFSLLVTQILSADAESQQAAAWVLTHVTDRYPWLISPHISKLVKNMRNSVHVAVHRATLRSLSMIDIPEKHWGEILDISFDFLLDTGQPPAVKVFAMTVIHNISKSLPEISRELKIVLEDQMPYGSAGFKSRASKILADLKKSGIA